MSDESPPSGDDPKPRRTFDVRAPRVTRSTKDSAHFQQRQERPRRIDRPRPDERTRETRNDIRRPNLVSSNPRRAIADQPTPEQEPPRPEPKRDPSPPPRAPSPVSRVVPVPVPVPVPDPSSSPSPSPSSLEDQLRILGARPVTEARKKKDKPRTAREALRARTSSPPKSGSKSERPRPQPEGDAEDPASDATAEAADRESDPPDSEPASSKPSSEKPAPAGLWAKIRGFFSKG